MDSCTAFPTINLKRSGARIKELRIQRNITVKEMQAYFNFEYPQSIYKWQNGDCLPTVDNLLALAHLLNVKMEDLLIVDDRGVSLFMS